MGFEEVLRSISFALVRFTSFSAHAFLFGTAVVTLFVLRTAFSSARRNAAGADRVAKRLEGFTRAALLASFAATSIGLLLQVLLVSEFEGGEVTGSSFDAVFATTFGQWYLLRLPLLAGAFVLLVGRVADVSLRGTAEDESAPSRAWWAGWLAIGALLLSTSTFSGHAAVASPQVVALVSDVVHLGAGAIWFTGIIILALILPDAWRDEGEGARIALLTPAVIAFSRVALISILIVGATGAINSFLNVGRWGDLFDTGYGRAVTAKIVLYLVVLALGGVNHFYVRARLQREMTEGSPERAHHLFKKTIAVELALAIGLMSVTGVLVGLARTRSETVQGAGLLSGRRL
ncbi:MAG: CopD family protein [Actinomycetota bacterium]|nr:CopD family protein [Actinomycetota bacterium]